MEGGREGKWEERKRERREEREKKKQRDKRADREREDKEKIEVAWEAGSWGRKAILQPLRRSKVHMKFIKCSFP